MAIQARKPEQKEYALAPKGRHQAVLLGIVDRGDQPNPFKDGKMEPKLSFHFETDKVDPDSGAPFQFSVWKTNSTFYSQKTGMMSGLVEFLTQWLDVSAADLKPALFDDLEALIGLNARVRLGHEPKKDGTGDRVKMTSIEPWEDGDGALLVPSQGIADLPAPEPKSLTQFWAEINGGGAVVQVPARRPLPTPQNTVAEKDTRFAEQKTPEQQRKEMLKGMQNGEAPNLPRPTPVAAYPADDDNGEDPFADE